MAHNRTPLADVEDDDTFWNGTPEQIADRLRPYVELGFRTVISRAAGALRRRDARAVHRRGRAAAGRLAGRSPSAARVAVQLSRHASRIARASGAVGRRGELRIAASSRRVGDELIDRRRRRPGRVARSVGRWPTSRSSLSMAPMATAARGRLRSRRPTRRRARSRRARARGRACRGRSGGPRAGRRRARSRGRPCRASRSNGPARGPARRPSRSPGRRPRGARPCSICERASRSEPSATAAPQPRPDRPDDAECHRLGERVRVGRQERFERVGHRVDPGRGRRRPAAGRRSGPGRGSS